MSYKIVADSCTDLSEELKEAGYIHLVPLTLEVGGKAVVDDENFNQADFLQMMDECEECPKSACPSPESYMRAFDGADEIFVVTLSSKLSGSYNSAELAKMLYLEQHPNRKIAVIDSQSASVGQTLIAVRLHELKEQGCSFEETVEKITRYRDQMQTKFVLESIENLRKNGRMSNITAVICNVLNIKPILYGVEGVIEKLDQARGMVKALQKMIAFIEKDATDAKHRTLAISHCNNPERANYVKEEILKRVSFAKVIVTNMAGVSTMYANKGGIIVTY